MNVTYKDCIPFKGQSVSVGENHRIIPGKLFYYYGQLLDVTEEAIKLQMTNGTKIIPLHKIKEIKRRRR